MGQNMGEVCVCSEGLDLYLFVRTMSSSGDEGSRGWTNLEGSLKHPSIPPRHLGRHAHWRWITGCRKAIDLPYLIITYTNLSSLDPAKGHNGS